MWICWMLLVAIICLNLFVVVHAVEKNITIDSLFLYVGIKFVIEYIIVSIPFLWIRIFHVEYVLFLLGVLNTMETIMVCKRSRVKVSITKESVWIFVALILLFPLVNKTSEEINSKSDQGAYFNYIMILTRGESKDMYRLNEYGKYSSSIDAELEILQNDLSCIYHEEGVWEDFTVHSIKTWCIFPALFAKILGVKKCMRSLTLAYFLLFFLIIDMSASIRKTKYVEYIAGAIFALSPLSIYIAKAGLAEMYFCLFVFIGLDFFVKKECEIYNSCIIGVAWGIAAFVHASFLFYVPILYIILFVSTLRRSKWFQISNIIMCVLVILSLWYSKAVSLLYVRGQFQTILNKTGLSLNVLLGLLSFAMGVLCVVQLLSAFSIGYYIERVVDYINKTFRMWCVVILMITLSAIKKMGYYLASTDLLKVEYAAESSWSFRNAYINRGIEAISHLNIVNLGRATGVVCLIIVVMIPFVKRKYDTIYMYLYALFLYAMIYSCYYRLDTPYNYYCSRYLFPVIVPLVIVISIGIIDDIYRVIIYGIIAIIYFSQFWPVLLTSAPAYGKFEMLEDVSNIIPESALVMMDIDEKPYDMWSTDLTMYLRTIESDLVYNYESLDEINEYDNRMKYVISDSKISKGKMIFNKEYQFQYYLSNMENGRYVTNNSTYKKQMYIYECYND